MSADIDNLRLAKKALEVAILGIVLRFEEVSGLVVHGLRVERLDISGNCGINSAAVRVWADVRMED